MTKLTTQEWIVRAKNTHGEMYDYAQAHYVNSATKLDIVCKKHGLFQQRPYDHVNGTGCRKCSVDNNKKTRNNMGTKGFIEKSVSKHSNKYDYSFVIYTGLYNQVKIICRDHGEFLQEARVHLQGCGCPKCAIESQKAKLTMPFSEFCSKAIKVHGTKYIYSESTYKDAITVTTIECKEHGKFEQTPSNHIRGSNCPACSIMAASRKKTIKWNELHTSFVSMHGDRYTYNPDCYTGSKSKIEIICSAHGSFYQSVSVHKSGGGCPKCGNSSTWSYTDWELAGKKSLKFSAYQLYIIECWNNDERFIKVGKTFYQIKQRFKSKAMMPYKWKTINIIEGSSREISELEVKLHNICAEYTYLPNIHFGGSTECFNLEAIKLLASPRL